MSKLKEGHTHQKPYEKRGQQKKKSNGGMSLGKSNGKRQKFMPNLRWGFALIKQTHERNLTLIWKNSRKKASWVICFRLFLCVSLSSSFSTYFSQNPRHHGVLPLPKFSLFIFNNILFWIKPNYQLSNLKGGEKTPQ